MLQTNSLNILNIDFNNGIIKPVSSDIDRIKEKLNKHMLEVSSSGCRRTYICVKTKPSTKDLYVFECYFSGALTDVEYKLGDSFKNEDDKKQQNKIMLNELKNWDVVYREFDAQYRACFKFLVDLFDTSFKSCISQNGELESVSATTADHSEDEWVLIPNIDPRSKPTFHHCNGDALSGNELDETVFKCELDKSLEAKANDFSKTLTMEFAEVFLKQQLYLDCKNADKKPRISALEIHKKFAPFYCLGTPIKGSEVKKTLLEEHEKFNAKHPEKDFCIFFMPVARTVIFGEHVGHAYCVVMDHKEILLINPKIANITVWPLPIDQVCHAGHQPLTNSTDCVRYSSWIGYQIVECICEKKVMYLDQCWGKNTKSKNDPKIWLDNNIRKADRKTLLEYCNMKEGFTLLKLADHKEDRDCPKETSGVDVFDDDCVLDGCVYVLEGGLN